MFQVTSHNQIAQAVTSQPIVLQKEKDAYQFWIFLNRNFPRTERPNLGRKISDLFLIIMNSTYASSYLQPEDKINKLTTIISKHDELKFFVQLAWEMELIPTNKYANLSNRLVEIGRMLGGWRNDTQKRISKSKTPAK